jgi:hypothetical protein
MAFFGSFVIDREQYRLMLPEGFVSGGSKNIPGESRTVELWSGSLGGDAHTTVTVNITPLASRHLGQILERAARGLRAAHSAPGRLRVPGALDLSASMADE